MIVHDHFHVKFNINFKHEIKFRKQTEQSIKFHMGVSRFKGMRYPYRRE